MDNLINHPKYYASCSEKTRHILAFLGVQEEYFEKECIDAIEQHSFVWSSFHLGEVVTHLWRYGNKPGEELKDLKKAEWYLMRLYYLKWGDLYTEKWKEAAQMVRDLIDAEF